MRNKTTRVKLWIKGALLLSVVFVNFLFNHASAQVLLDAHSLGNGATTWNITTTQPNELILISAGGYGILSTAAGTVTVNGNNATYENEGIETDGDSWSCAIWAYAAPVAGTYTLVCTETGASSPFYFNYAASVYQPANVLGLGNIILGGNGNNNALTSVSATITTTIANSYIYGYENFNDNGNTGTVAWTTLTELDHNYIDDGIDGAHAGATVPAGTYTITVTDIGASNPYAVMDLIAVQPSGGCTLTATSSVTANESCNGGNTGSATVTPASGTAPYTYSWNPGGKTTATVSTLSAGTYTITVTDHAGCIATTTVTITQPTPLTATMGAPTNDLCNGGNNGSATVTAGGGTPNYTYAWSPAGGTGATGTGLTVGSYTVTVRDNNGCTATASVTITQPTPVTITMASHTNATCSTLGSATANAATGGTSPYTYTWTPSGGTNLTAANLSAGTYTITATDNHGCTGTASVTITQAASTVAITIASHTNATCSTLGSATANAATGGVAPYTYAWTPSGGTNLTASNLSAGTYTITATDHNGCTGTASVTITQAASTVAITIASHTNVMCAILGSATANAATGGVAPYTYAWTPSGGTNLTASNLSAGTYTITATDHNGCTGTASVTITTIASTLAITIASHTNATCATLGSATANAATGGTSPYTYAWTPSGGTNLLASNLSAGTYTITATDINGCTATASIAITQAASTLAITIASHTDVMCSTLGTATANAATGGTSPYTYAWTPSGGTNLAASNLSAGTYTITATDNNGCTATASVTIAQGTSSLAITIASHTNILCNTIGSATANAATGGTSPYTYAWSPSGGTNLLASNLSAGTYTITATDINGCTATASVTITQAAATLNITIASKTTLVCEGFGYITAHAATGGTPPYNYLWTPSGGTNLATTTNLTAGTYTITATDSNGCTATVSETIAYPAHLNATSNVTKIPNCFDGKDGSATVTPTGGTPAYTYSWFPGSGTNATESGLSAGVYTVTVSDSNGCTVSIDVTVTQPAGMVIKTDSVDNSSTGGCNGQSWVQVVSGGAPPYTYLWSPGGQTTDTINKQCSGVYCCTVTDKNGCSLSVCTIINNTVGIANINGNSAGVTIYPDPNNGVFTIDGIEKGMQVEIYDYIGRNISTTEATDVTMRYNISNQANGIYLIRILTKDGLLVSQQKIIKTQ